MKYVLYESKLRSVNDYNCAKDGVKQLYEDYNIIVPDILKFTLKILKQNDSDLYHPFIKYLRDRNENTHLDNFRLSLCWEKDSWNERVLANLESEETNLSKLNVHVTRINNLNNIINLVFSELKDEGLLDE